MDLPALFITIIIGTVVFAVVVAIIDEMTPGTPIEPSQALDHMGEKVEMTLTIKKKIDESCDLSFFIMMPIVTTVGNTTITNFIPIPIFDDHYVYSTNHDHIFAFSEEKLESGEQKFTGWIRKDKEKKEVCFLEI